MSPLTGALVRTILQNAQSFDWTIQGFGMLRLNLRKIGRIHVWDKQFAVPDVSVIHNHPWSLRSTIISGCLSNVRYELVEDEKRHTHLRQRLVTGEGGRLLDKPLPVNLRPRSFEWYGPGDTYEQAASEIHESRPFDGTVTLMERPKGLSDEVASVFWPLDTEWVSAEPRPAEPREVLLITTRALELWDKQSEFGLFDHLPSNV